MRRRLLHTLLALCFLLGVANVALWVVSYWRVYHVGLYECDWPQPRNLSTRSRSIQMTRGHWALGWDEYTVDWTDLDVALADRRTAWREAFAETHLAEPVLMFLHAPFRTGLAAPNHLLAMPGVGIPTRWGFGYDHKSTATSDMQLLIFPAWFSTALFLIPPLIYLSPWLRRRRRRRAGLCPTCAYDLRGSPLPGPGAGAGAFPGVKVTCPECGTTTVSSALHHLGRR